MRRFGSCSNLFFCSVHPEDPLSRRHIEHRPKTESPAPASPTYPILEVSVSAVRAVHFINALVSSELVTAVRWVAPMATKRLIFAFCPPVLRHFWLRTFSHQTLWLYSSTKIYESLCISYFRFHFLEFNLYFANLFFGILCFYFFPKNPSSVHKCYTVYRICTLLLPYLNVIVTAVLKPLFT